MHEEKKIHNYKYSEESILIETMQKKEKFNYDEDQLEILLGECIAQIDKIYQRFHRFQRFQQALVIFFPFLSTRFQRFHRFHRFHSVLVIFFPFLSLV